MKIVQAKENEREHIVEYKVIDSCIYALFVLTSK